MIHSKFSIWPRFASNVSLFRLPVWDSYNTVLQSQHHSLVSFWMPSACLFQRNYLLFLVRYLWCIILLKQHIEPIFSIYCSVEINLPLFIEINRSMSRCKSFEEHILISRLLTEPANCNSNTEVIRKNEDVQLLYGQLLI